MRDDMLIAPGASVRRVARFAVCLCAGGLMIANQAGAQTTHGGDLQGSAYRSSTPDQRRPAREPLPRMGSNPYRALPRNEQGYDARGDARIQNDPFANRRWLAGPDWRSRAANERPDFEQFNAAREQRGFDRMDWNVPDRRFENGPRGSDFEGRWPSGYRGESGDRFSPRGREDFSADRQMDWNTGRRTGGFETGRWNDDSRFDAGRRFGETDRMAGWERGFQDGITGRRTADWDTRDGFGDFNAPRRFGETGPDRFDPDFRGAARVGGFDGSRRSISGQAAAQFGSSDFGPQDAAPGRRGFGPSAMGRSAIDGGYRGGIGRSGVNPSGLSGSGFGRSEIGDGFDSGIGGDFGRGGLGQSGFGGPGTTSGFGGSTAGGSGLPSSGLGGTGFGGSGIGSNSGFGDGGIGGPGLGGSGSTGAGTAGGTGGR